DGHTDTINSVLLTPDEKKIISASSDSTIKVWDADSGKCIGTLEGHLAPVNHICLSKDGASLFSNSDDSSIKIWDVKSGSCLATLLDPSRGSVIDFSLSANGQRGVSVSSVGRMNIWDIPKLKSQTTSESNETLYTNAKIALVGESGAGKTGLALRLGEDRWEETGSTHGMTIRNLPLHEKSPEGMKREVLLWDFAGQPDYRLVHQLYMDETALALMVFDPQKDDPFVHLGHWEKALHSAVKINPEKLLVAARVDMGGLTISNKKISEYQMERGYADCLPTSAKTGEGCRELKQKICEIIPWDRIPFTSTTRLFKALKEAIIDLQQGNVHLLTFAELRQQLQVDHAKVPFNNAELRTVVGLMAGQGVIRTLDFGDLVLLRPELINTYASVVIKCAREHAEEIGSVREEAVLKAKIPFPQGMERLPHNEEHNLLRAMLDMFVNRSLCLREEISPGNVNLIFPSHFKRDRELPELPKIIFTYGFNGILDEIYASLVVRLHHVDGYSAVELWKDAADFTTPSGNRAGLAMTRYKKEQAELKIYFEESVPEDEQITFLKYIHEHLNRRVKGEVSRVREYSCNHCHEPLENRKAIRRRLEMGKKDILCSLCEERVDLIDVLEMKYNSDKFAQIVRKMEEQSQVNIDNESRELILVGQAFVVAGEAGQIFRPIANSDWGIDGEIEFKDDSGNASGERVYLQLKSGDSYLYDRKRDAKEIFTIKNSRHADYWKKQKYPVMLVIRQSDGLIRWMDVKKYLLNSPLNTNKIEFEGESFDASTLYSYRNRLNEEMPL
ncbi:MAG: DUF4365 domain-containing protein, partial [Magnetococcales bacterium]|nr:DUF4365 domain-containing protein [Magnetococcales bacterium]